MKNMLAAIAVFACLAVEADTTVIHTPGLVESVGNVACGAVGAVGGMVFGGTTVVTTPNCVAPAYTAAYGYPVTVPVVVTPPVPMVVAPTVVAPVTPLYVRPHYYNRYGRFYRDYYYGVPRCGCFYY